MSIKALFYITGDTQQTGFRRIGSSESFPANSLPYLNNGDPIQERARVETNGASSGAGVKTLSHVWEYQTGKYGYPVVINTMVAIGTGRAHGFSEYIAGETDNVADLAGANLMIAAAERFDLLNVEDFMSIPGATMIECSDSAVWDLQDADASLMDEPFEISDEWRKTVLAHYWKQASIRAFSKNTPKTVRVNLGKFSDNTIEEIETTISKAKKFFSSVIVPGLPRQVQNIASMAAGVNCAADQCNLFSAIEFDITQGMYADETLCIDKPGIPRFYRLSPGELEFITEVSNGAIPAVVQRVFDLYKTRVNDNELTETTVPFMADYRVWYSLYCYEKIIKEKHNFIEKAHLTKEKGNPDDLRDARVCFLLMSQLRLILEEEHKLNTSLVTELIEDLETGLLQVMLEDMNKPDAKAFLLRKKEMLEFHRRTLYTAKESQLKLLIDLAVMDAKAYQTPQFVRCYHETPIRNEQADIRNAKLLEALLPATITPLIESDIKSNKETIENKYVRALGSDDGFRKCAAQHNETNRAVCDFLKKEIQNADKHFLIYGLSKKYLPVDELLLKTIEHLEKYHYTQNSRPNKRQIEIAADGAKDYISGTHINQACVKAMNQYYQACFRDYRGSVGEISKEIVNRLGGDTTSAMTMIFKEHTTRDRLNADEAKAVFNTFGGENGRLIRDSVIISYIDMLKAQRKAILSNPNADRKSFIQWLGSMIEAAPFEIDVSEDMADLFDHAANGEHMSAEEANIIFNCSFKPQDFIYSKRYIRETNSYRYLYPYD